MTTAACPPNWFGDSCDLPMCSRGRIDYETKRCICEKHFSPPFCNSCLPGYWGADCRGTTITPEREAPQFTLILALYPIAIATLILLFCCLVYYVVVETLRRRCGRPPSYSEVLLDAPPPYNQVIVCDQPSLQLYRNPKCV